MMRVGPVTKVTFTFLSSFSTFLGTPVVFGKGCLWVRLMTGAVVEQTGRVSTLEATIA